MRLLIIFVIFWPASCKSKYPAENYVIPKLHRDLIVSYKEGDTLKFKDGKGNYSLYLLTKIDSSFIDEGRGLMNVRGRKDIVISVQELTNPARGHENYDLIILNKYPDEERSTFDLRLRDFYGIDTTEPFALKNDTVTANDLLFSHYYSFRPYHYTEQKDSNSVSRIYMTREDGIIAYRCRNGNWWTKAK